MSRKRGYKHNIERSTIKCERCNEDYVLRTDRVELHKKACGGRNLCKKCKCNERRKERASQDNPLARDTGKKTKAGNPVYTVECACCHKDFEVPYMKRSARFCSRSCQATGSQVSGALSVKKTSLCKICSKPFEHYGDKATCSELCYSRFLSQARIGENNPAFKKEKEIKGNCPNCKKDFSYTRGGIAKGRRKIFCTRVCHVDYVSKHGQWCSFHDEQKWDPTKYVGFSRKIADEIRERDGHKCVLCSGASKAKHTSNLPIHHIDYDTNNQDPSNLVTLCVRCHNMTNSNQHFWENVFSSLRGGAKIVKKVWGLESHITNNPDFCLKYLIFFKGGKLSLHAHTIKKELFHCLMGKFGVTLLKDGKEEKFLIKAGDKIMLEPGTFHSLEAFKNSIIVEVSTQDFPEDSHRLIESSFNEDNDSNIKEYLPKQE